MTEKITMINKRIIQRLYKEILVDWNMDMVEELIAPQFMSHDWPKDSPTGPQQFKDFYTNIIRFVFPDARYEVDDLIAERDKVVVRWRMLGTHRGTYQDIIPTGRHITLQGIAIYRMEDGKVIERWVFTNIYNLLEEIQGKPSNWQP